MICNTDTLAKSRNGIFGRPSQMGRENRRNGIIGVSDAVTIAGMYAERAAYNTKKWMMEKVYELLELLYQAAGLVIDTVRTFFLIVLSI